jgi:hypothetical protein
MNVGTKLSVIVVPSLDRWHYNMHVTTIHRDKGSRANPVIVVTITDRHSGHSSSLQWLLRGMTLWNARDHVIFRDTTLSQQFVGV